MTTKSLGSGISLSNEYDEAIWELMSDIQPNTITQSTQQILGMIPVLFAPERVSGRLNINDDKKSTHGTLVGYADGGSRGNPGQSAAGLVLIDTTGAVVAEVGEHIGFATVCNKNLYRVI